jgi:uncharacterized protein YtpQ (UPF0354 family)
MTMFSTFSNWLSRSKAEKRRFADLAEFRERVIAAFNKRPGVNAAANASNPAAIEIRIGDWTAAGDVTNIFGHLTAYPAENADDTIERFVRACLERKTETLDEKNIVAVIRSREYIDLLEKKGLAILHEPLGADLIVTYMADRPDSMSPIATRDVPGKDLQSIRAIALNNIRPWLGKVVADEQLQVGALYFVQDNTMLSTSLILIDEFWQSIKTRFPGDTLIALPRRDQLFIFDAADSKAKAVARRLIDVTTREGFNLLSQKLYARRDSQIVLVDD